MRGQPAIMQGCGATIPRLKAKLQVSVEAMRASHTNPE